MHERKVEMARRSCGFIGLPGGYGTFEEIFEVTTWTQLGIHSKRMRSNLLTSFTQLTDPVCSRCPGERSGILRTGPGPYSKRNKGWLHPASGGESGEIRRWSF